MIEGLVTFLIGLGVVAFAFVLLVLLVRIVSFVEDRLEIDAAIQFIIILITMFVIVLSWLIGSDIVNQLGLFK